MAASKPKMMPAKLAMPKGSAPKITKQPGNTPPGGKLPAKMVDASKKILPTAENPGGKHPVKAQGNMLAKMQSPITGPKPDPFTSRTQGRAFKKGGIAKC